MIPASLVAFHLGKPLIYLHINYRDKNNKPQYDSHKIISNFDANLVNQRILLVDDVSVSGKTFDIAKHYLDGNVVTTFAVKGTAEIVLFPEISKCVNWPWKENHPEN